MSPSVIVDRYIVDFDVSNPAGGFRFEWNAVDVDALMLTSDNLPQGADFLAGADHFNVIFTVPLGQLGCDDIGQGRCYVYGEHDRVSFAYIPEPGILVLLGLGLAGLTATRRRKQ